MSALPLNARLMLACALALSTPPVIAQQHDHGTMQMQDMPGMDMTTPDNAARPEKAAKKPSLQKPAPKKAAKEIPKPDPHAGHHGMTMPMAHEAPAASPRPPAKPDAGHAAHHPAPSPDPHAGHAMPADMPMPQTDGGMDHAHMQHMHATPTAPVFAAPTAEELAAAFPDLGGMDMSLHMDDDPTVAVLRGDRLEHVEGGATAWDMRFGVGGNFDKLWLRSEGEKPGNGPAEGDVELQWSHATGPWWDRVVSLRSDSGPGPSRQWLGVGVAGLAPYKFEVEAHAYVGSEGRLAATVEGEYELLLTNRLILQPRVELRAYSKDDPANRIGQGLSSAEGGLRLRYEITRHFAPYVGYTWTHQLGQTADLLRARDEVTQDQGWVAGLRFWF